MKPMYFGCWTDVGHHLYDQNGQYVDRTTRDLLIAMGIDGGFVPKARQEHGFGWVTVIGSLTILAVHDFKVDKRPGSHSTFILPGKLTFGEACEAAKRFFPHVCERFTEMQKVTL